MPSIEASESEVAAILAARAQPPDVIDTTFEDALPTAEAVAATHRYYTELRASLLRRVAEVEQYFGFTAQAEDLSVRVAKLESFVFGRK